MSLVSSLASSLEPDAASLLLARSSARGIAGAVRRVGRTIDNRRHVYVLMRPTTLIALYPTLGAF